MDRISLAVRRCVFAVVVVLLGWSSGTARAHTLYGITFGGNQLITIDTVTGAGTLVGKLSSTMQAFGLAFRGTKLYAFDQAADRIQELDPKTGGTLSTIDIGTTRWGEGDIAFRSDGIGFIASELTGELSRFDLTVPNSALVGGLA